MQANDKWTTAEEGIAAGQGARFVMRIVGLVSGAPTAFDGEWLVNYDATCPGLDPEGQPMSVTLETTPDVAAAKRFESVAAAHELWTTATGRIRPDGKPDRPFTAFNIEVVSLTTAQRT